jgi:predicted hotdog family 3-hydroxylacyl-ACP dehydratase
MSPATLDHAGIAARVPHSGSMCLLDKLVSWADDSITCTAISHHDLHNPLRCGEGLLAANAIEYAVQGHGLRGVFDSVGG